MAFFPIMQKFIWGFYSLLGKSPLNFEEITHWLVNKRKLSNYALRYQSQDFTQILALSTILDLKDSTVSLPCRASGGKLVFLTIFVSNCHLNVNKRHAFLAYLSLLFWSFYGGGHPLQFLRIFWKRKKYFNKKITPHLLTHYKVSLDEIWG